MNLREYLIQNIPRWVGNEVIFMRLYSADGMCLAGIPTVSSINSDQIIQIMLSNAPFFDQYLECKVLKEENQSITIDWYAKTNNLEGG